MKVYKSLCDPLHIDMIKQGTKLMPNGGDLLTREKIFL